MPGMKDIRLKDMPANSLPTNPDDFMLNFMIEQTQNCAKSSSVIINTFYEFEKEVLDALSSSFPQIYTIGPLTQLINRSLPKPQQNLSTWKESTDCLTWLDSRDPKSVVYVNFESAAIMNKKQMSIIADGLERCGLYFLLVLPDILKDEDKENLLEGFVERTKDRSLIASWYPQKMVLKHPSVGLFDKHGGWTSMTESVVSGIAVVFGLWVEQPTNSRQVCLVWRDRMEIQKNMDGSEIAELVREMMTSDNNERKVKRDKALEWKKIAEEATINGGSSYLSFEKLVKEILRQ